MTKSGKDTPESQATSNDTKSSSEPLPKTDANGSTGSTGTTGVQTPVRKAGGWSNSPGVKFIIVGIITLLLLIPTLLVWGVVEERGARAVTVAQSISKGWGGEQVINGPYLVIPYSIEVIMKDRTRVETRYAVVSSDTVSFEADIDAQERRKSIYSTPLYHSKMKLNGRFGSSEVQRVLDEHEGVDLSSAFLVIGVSDNSGFRSQVTARLNNGQAQLFEPGTHRINNPRSRFSKQRYIRNSGGVYLPIDPATARAGFSFSIDLALNGSRSFHVVPAGKNTKIGIKSNWPHPGFDGQFLPETRSISDDGFKAQWTVPYLARGIGAVTLSSALPNNSSVVSLNFVEPLQFYQIVSRTLKYAIAFFALIFLATFILEQIGSRRVHWIQYILVGLALVIFYVLLLALAEHVGFNFAYLVAASLTTGLVSWYVGHALGGGKKVAVIGGVVGLAYLVIFLVMKEQEYALLAGSLVAFAAIALTMFFTRNIDWSAEGGLNVRPA